MNKKVIIKKKIKLSLAKINQTDFSVKKLNNAFDALSDISIDMSKSVVSGKMFSKIYSDEEENDNKKENKLTEEEIENYEKSLSSEEIKQSHKASEENKKNSDLFDESSKKTVDDDSLLTAQQLEERKQKIENAKHSMEKQKARKSKIINAVFFCVNIVVVAFILVYQLSNESVTNLWDIKNLRIGFLFLVVFLFAAVMFFDAFRINTFIKKSGHRGRPALSYKVVSLGRYYDCVTPMSTGGQPFQVFYLNARGHTTSASISVPMGRYVFSQIAWVLMSVFAVIYVFANSLQGGALVGAASIVGFSLNALLVAVIIVISLSKRLGEKIIVFVLKLLQKIRIVKNFEKQYERVMSVVGGYQETIKMYAKSKLTFISMLGVSILYIIANYSIPFFIYLFLGGVDASVYLQILTLAIVIEISASFIPLPGGTGMAEVAFMSVFSSIFPSGTIVWALLLWRFMTYYIYLVQGLGVLVYDYFIGNKKYKWQKRKWELEAESVTFKEKQIRLYNKRRVVRKTLKM